MNSLKYLSILYKFHMCLNEFIFFSVQVSPEHVSNNRCLMTIYIIFVSWIFFTKLSPRRWRNNSAIVKFFFKLEFETLTEQ